MSEYENLILAQDLSNKIFTTWQNERFKHEDSIGLPFVYFMTIVIAVVFIFVLFENFAIYSANILKKEEKLEEFSKIEELK